MQLNNTTIISHSNTGEDSVLKSGYDLPVYGLNDSTFYQIHIPALTCIFLSFCSVVAILVMSFRFQSYKTFFSWTRSERFVVYLALCDGLFNVAHTVDHLHIVISRNHVYPKELCEFYGFMLMEFITAQVLMVNIIAINAFVLIYFRKQIQYGQKDWKLLLYTFGAPFIAATIAAIAGTLGPNGSFCYFDGVKGEIVNIFFTTVLLLIVLAVNTVFYILTWQRIYVETKQLKNSLGSKAKTLRASHNAARTMSLFVAAFLFQWWAMALYGIWQVIDTVPQALHQLVTTFSNLGGVLNGLVFIIIRRRKLLGSDHTSEFVSTTKSSESSLENKPRQTKKDGDSKVSTI